MTISADEILLTNWPEKDIAIYVLIDPRNGEHRYVGQSSDPYGRLYQHWSSPHSIDLRRWICKLRAEDELPELAILEWVENAHAWDRERFWIQWGISKGWKLLNKQGRPLDIEKHKSLGRWLKKIRHELRAYEGDLGQQYARSKKVMKALHKLSQDIDALRCALDSEVFKENPRIEFKTKTSVYY